MSREEQLALDIANKYKGHVQTVDKVKWLATEVVEVGMALQEGNDEHLLEELGDCAFLISHIISRHDKDKKGILYFITLAAEKMEKRNSQP